MGCGASIKGRVAPVDDEPPRFLKMYHGTSLTAARAIEREGFTPSEGGELGPGIYFVDEHNVDKAKRFAHDAFNRLQGTPHATAENEPALLECLVHVRRHYAAECPDRVGSWRHRGFDACCTERTAVSASTEWCVAEASQVQVVAVRDLRGTPCPWDKFCPYTTKTKIAHTPWGGPCPCNELQPPTCKRLGCGKPTWNGKAGEFCSRSCRKAEAAPPALCVRPGCGKPTWNGRPGGYCDKTCRDVLAVEGGKDGILTLVRSQLLWHQPRLGERATLMAGCPGVTVKRSTGYCGAVVIARNPARQFRVRVVDNSGDWSGAMELGFTATHPDKLVGTVPAQASDLPRCWVMHNAGSLKVDDVPVRGHVESGSNWHEALKTGDTLRVAIVDRGGAAPTEFVVEANGVVKVKAAIDDVEPSLWLYPVVGVYGKTTAVELLHD